MKSDNQGRGTKVRAPRGAIELSTDRQEIGADPRKMQKEILISLGHEPKPLLCIIREKCLDCCSGSTGEVRKCVSATCPLWPYRMATNPLRKRRKVDEGQREKLVRRAAEARRARRASV